MYLIGNDNLLAYTTILIIVIRWLFTHATHLNFTVIQCWMFVIWLFITSIFTICTCMLIYNSYYHYMHCTPVYCILTFCQPAQVLLINCQKTYNYVGWWCEKYVLLTELIILSLFFLNHCNSYVTVHFIEMCFFYLHVHDMVCLCVISTCKIQHVQ